jgi:hypothetical protein
MEAAPGMDRRPSAAGSPGRRRRAGAPGRAAAELRLLRAFHEAGHAVTAVLLGARVERVTLRWDGPLAGGCAVRIREGARGGAGEPAQEEARLRAARTAIAVALGGTVAQERFARERGYDLRAAQPSKRARLFAPGGQGDEHVALAAAAGIAGPGPARRRLVRLCRDDVAALLGSRSGWRAVRRVARALLRRGTLSGPQLGTLVVALHEGAPARAVAAQRL